MKKLPTLAVALLVTVGLGVVAGLTQAGTAPDDHAVIKKVMKTAFNKKSGLNGRVASGQANDAQKKELLGLYQDLAKARPEKGDPASWDAKTRALVDAAQAAVDGKPDAGAQLKSAANCKACHQAHREQ